MKLATIGYVPPTGVGFPEAFLKNIRAYKTEHPVLLFSDAPEAHGLQLRCHNPGEAVLYRNVPLSISNWLFMKAIDIAVANEIEFFCYLEPDVRVRGDFWDGKMFTEFMLHKSALIGGTPAIYNLGLTNAATAIRAIQFANACIKKTGRPPLVWQGGARGDCPVLYIFCNGAGGIYHTATVNAIFGGRKMDVGTYAAQLGAWDTFVGRGMVNQFGDDMFERFAILRSQYSGFREVHYGLHERIKMLEDGEVVLIHQVKTDYVPGL